jgi:hypothetical protein
VYLFSEKDIIAIFCAEQFNGATMVSNSKSCDRTNLAYSSRV